MTDHAATIYAVQSLESALKRHQCGQATDADLEAAWDALLALRWRPIEEAPHNTLVWLLWESGLCIGYYDPPDDILALKGGWWLRARIDAHLRYPCVPSLSHRCKAGDEPTAWQPLPPAPGDF